MDVLLDTHAFIWFINGDNQLSSKSKKIIKNIDNNCFISIASIWDIAIKISLKRLDINSGFKNLVKVIEENKFEILPVTFEHIQYLLDLDYYHRDPFDRMIIAQGLSEKVSIITKDQNFNKYEVEIIW